MSLDDDIISITAGRKSLNESYNNNNNSFGLSPSPVHVRARHSSKRDSKREPSKRSRSNHIEDDSEEVWIEKRDDDAPPTARRPLPYNHNHVEETPLSQVVHHPDRLPTEERLSQISQALFLPRTTTRGQHNNKEEEDIPYTDPSVIEILSQEPLTNSKVIQLRSGYHLPSPSTPLWSHLIGEEESDNNNNNNRISLPLPAPSMNLLENASDEEELLLLASDHLDGPLTQENLQQQHQNISLQRKSQTHPSNPTRKSNSKRNPKTASGKTLEEWAREMNSFFDAIDQRQLIEGNRQRPRRGMSSKVPPRQHSSTRSTKSVKVNNFSDMIAMAKMKSDSMRKN
ncbi:hypothetical protein ADEAN_000202000 [Angomonas deanei]|uniref:Uncharacterized protein n=1 Tax=Angomonas deanei TaxID=59799 RepID=A0A7G2C4M7_9TRYP|nr:hypothetical protein ADEAN_000202000 [Angomonas deanei]